MKIINLEQFYKLTPGTVYCKYDPQVLDDLRIFESACIHDGKPIDFIYSPLIEIMSSGSDEEHDILVDARENGTNVTLEADCTSRDGMFEEDQLFAVFTDADLEIMITMLRRGFGKIK